MSGQRGHSVSSLVAVTLNDVPRFRSSVLCATIPSVGASASASTLRSPFQSPTTRAVAPAHADPAGSVAQPVQLFDGWNEFAASKTWTCALPPGSVYSETRSSFPSPEAVRRWVEQVHTHACIRVLVQGGKLLRAAGPREAADGEAHA